ncbi:MAG: ester cyclase [Candidatus Geothermarchaeales archaeon]
MSVEENIRVIDTLIEALNNRELDRWESLHSKPVIWHGPEFSKPLRGRDVLRKILEVPLTAFPDSRLEKQRAFGQGNWVCVELVERGTHTGPLNTGDQPIPATNRAFKITVCRVYKLNEGRITEGHEYYDLMGLLGQLGLAS